MQTISSVQYAYRIVSILFKKLDKICVQDDEVPKVGC